MFSFQINEDLNSKCLNVENLKKSLQKELENKFELEFGITTTWLNCGSSLKNPLEKVLFFKKPLCEDESIVLDDTPYQNLYPMNE